MKRLTQRQPVGGVGTCHIDFCVAGHKSTSCYVFVAIATLKILAVLQYYDRKTRRKLHGLFVFSMCTSSESTNRGDMLSKHYKASFFGTDAGAPL